MTKTKAADAALSVDHDLAMEPVSADFANPPVLVLLV